MHLALARRARPSIAAATAVATLTAIGGSAALASGGSSGSTEAGGNLYGATNGIAGNAIRT